MKNFWMYFKVTSRMGPEYFIPVLIALTGAGFVLLLVALGLILTLSGVSYGGQQDLRWMGLDYVGKSLNKQVVVTPRQSWTNHQPGNTGVDYRVVVCPTITKEGKNNEKRTNAASSTWNSGTPNNPFCGFGARGGY